MKKQLNCLKVCVWVKEVSEQLSKSDDKYYNDMSDIEIISCIREGDTLAQDFIIGRYKNLVKMKTRAYFIVGADKEDIIQEGMIGLYKAIRDFDENKEVSFFSFAEICITRQIITAIKSATRQKHIPLNSYVSLNKVTYDNDGTILDEALEKRALTPEEHLIDKESKNYIEKNMVQSLSQLEWKVLSLYLDGNSYVEMAKMIHKDEKSIDNALQRIRKKVEKILTKKNLTDVSKCAKI